MFELFFVINWLGWTILAILTIIILTVVENEKWGWSTLVALLTAGVLYYFLPSSVLGVPSFWSVVIYVVGYVAVGVAWSFFKWTLYVLKAKETYFRMGGKTKANIEDYIPVARQNRSNIVGWMAFWPWSALWTIIDDPIKRMYRAMARSLERVFDNISRRMFGV